jgi:hypothetical protein
LALDQQRDRGTDDLDVQLALAGEVAVHECVGGAGGCRDGGDADLLVGRLRERFPGRVEDRGTALLTAQPPAGATVDTGHAITVSLVR